jgi:hypothetical protein
VSLGIGRKFGRLTITKELQKNALYLCDCKCGWQLEVFYSQLTRRIKLDCGLCRPRVTWKGGVHHYDPVRNIDHRRLVPTKRRRRYGKCKGSRIYKHLTSAEMNSWSSMIGRCNRPNDPGYKHYGGRGIRICERWSGGSKGVQSNEGFLNFIRDMGPRPKGMSLDRINVQGHYEPTNCKWSTQAFQRMNQRRIIFRGRRIPKVEKVKQMEERVRLLAAGHFDGMSFDGEVPETF